MNQNEKNRKQRASDAEELAQARISDEDRGSQLPEAAMIVIVIVNCQ